MGKEHSQNVEPDLAIALSRTPMFGEFAHPRALPYNHCKNNKGCVTMWPCHLYFKIPQGKRRIMKIQLFHHAKI
jgi:hypothetical protein